MSGWRDHLYLRYDFPGVVPRLNHVCYAVLSECFSFVLCLSYVSLGMFFVCLMPVIRFSRNVLRSAHICHAFLSKCPVFDHACCLPPVRQTERLAGCSVSVPPWVGIAGSAFSNRRCGYRALGVHFGRVRFFMAIPTENERDAGTRRTEGTENGGGGAAEERFCVTALALLCFPRGVRWGCAPQTAPKSLRLSGLSSGAGRAAKCALHGGVGVVRIRGTVTRVYGKTRPALISGGRTAAGRAGRAVYC